MARQHVAICDQCGKREELDPSKAVTSLRGWVQATFERHAVGGPLRAYHFHTTQCMEKFIQETFK